MEHVKKRQVNGILKYILDTDKKISEKIVLWANKFLVLRSLRIHYKMLEVSCHGVPWLACWLALIWLINSKDLRQMQINMVLGLILDIIFIGILKALTRRRRPLPNTDDFFGTIGPDKFSFPSGHASRSVFIVYFFSSLYPIGLPFILPFYAWATSVCISRLLMYRHHLLDILCGVLLGIMEGILIGWIWLGEDACNYIYSEISDEKTEGAAHDV